MMVAAILQKITYCTLIFLIILSSFSFVAVAEDDLDETGDLGESSGTITLDKPISDKHFNTNSIVVEGTIKEGDFEITLFLNDEAVTTDISVYDSVWSTTLTDLEEGNYELVAKATNEEEIQYSSNVVTFIIDMTEPEIFITSPTEDNYYMNSAIISGVTEPYLEVILIVDGQEENYITVANDEGEWSINLNGYLQEGNYTFHARATDKAGNVGFSPTLTFILDKTRPHITVNMFPRANMTRVTLNTVVKMNVVDNHSINESDLLSAPFELVKKGESAPISGTFSYNQKEDNMIEVIFTPDSELLPNEKYIVHTNPFLTDRAGNFIHPRIWSFTTASNFAEKVPHGNYTNNVNTCRTCHRTHTASNSLLEQPSEELLSRVDPEQAFSSYCMACHDGTVALLPEKWGENSTHQFQLKTNDGRVVSQSCGSCHNPHLAWSDRNPNIFQDHFTFEHTVELDGVDEPFLADSKEQLCESCHDTDVLSRKIDERVDYTVFSYKNWNSTNFQLDEERGTFGEASDYQLCLRCHNSRYQLDYQNIVDIETFYKNESSAHFITNDRIKDGSLLNGHLPCADCHYSHGSANINMIKTELGHANSTSFTKETDSWTISEERAFCLTCHNNSTELYGITVSFQTEDEQGKMIEGHQTDSNLSCAFCHGGNTKNFLEAVHAPTR